MAVIKQKVNRTAVPIWIPLDAQPRPARPAVWQVVLARVRRFLDGDPEQEALAHQMRERIEKTHTDIYIDTGGQWF